MNTENYIITGCLALFILVTVSQTAFTQSTCNIINLKTTGVAGKVISQGRLKEPIPNTKVELFEVDGEVALQEALTDERGDFQMRNVETGKYRLVVWFTVQGQTYLKYDVILEVRKPAECKKIREELLIRLSASCFTSEAELVKIN